MATVDIIAKQDHARAFPGVAGDIRRDPFQQVGQQVGPPVHVAYGIEAPAWWNTDGLFAPAQTIKNPAHRMALHGYAGSDKRQAGGGRCGAMIPNRRPALGMEHMEYNNRSIARAFASLLGGNVLGQVVWLASAPILTRLYDPVVFGVWIFFMSGLLFAATVSTMRLELGIVTAPDDAQAGLVAGAALRIATLWFFVALTLAVLAGPALLELLEWRIDIAVLFTIPAMFALVGPQQVMLYWAVRRRRYAAVAANSVVQAAALNGVAILGGLLMQAGPLELIVASVAAYFLSNLSLAVTLGRDFPWPTILKSSLRPVIDAVRGNYRYPLYSTPYALVGMLGSRGLDLIAGLAYGAAATGHIGLAMRVSYLPLGLVTRPLNQLYFGLLSARRGDPNVARSVYQIEVMLILLAVPAAAAVALNAVPLALFVFGSEWEIAGSYIAWLMLPASCMLLTAWLDRTYDVIDRQRLALMLESGFHLLLVAAILVSIEFSDDPKWIVITFAVMVAVYNLFWLAVTFALAGFPAHYFPRLMLWLVASGGLVAASDIVAHRLGAAWNLPLTMGVLVMLWSVAAARGRRFLGMKWDAA